MAKINPFLWYAREARVAQAMLKMVKFDIAALQAAADARR